MVDGFQKLARAVIHRAVRDGLSRSEDLREDAAAFFLSASGRDLCELAGMDGQRLYTWAVQGCPKDQQEKTA